jgi:Na+/alanine symporter
LNSFKLELFPSAIDSLFLSPAKIDERNKCYKQNKKLPLKFLKIIILFLITVTKMERFEQMWKVENAEISLMSKRKANVY